MKKSVWILAVVALASFALAQQKAEDVIKAQCAKAQVVAELWHGFRGGAPRAALENLAVEFNKMHEGEGCLRPINQGGYRDLSTKIKAAFAAGTLPAMAQAFENNIALYLEADALLPLDGKLEYLDQLNPLFVNAVKFDGHLYGLPFNKSVQILYFNRDLLNKHGVEVPRTLDDFIAAAKKISAAEGEPVYWFRPDTSTYAYWFFNMGGSYVHEGKLVVNSPEAVKALETLVQGVQDGWAKPITSGYINQNFGKGAYGFSTDSSAGYSYYLKAAKFDLGIATLPGNGEHPGYGLVQGTNLIVFKDVDPAQQELALAFLNFVSSPKAQALFAAATGYVPVNLKAVDEPELQDYLLDNPDFQVVIDQGNYAVFEPAIAEWEQIRFDILGQAIKEAVLGKATPKEALDKAQKQVEDLLAGKIR
ncbi:ABC transporter substrate-binding protein [Oceanithermus sp.]